MFAVFICHPVGIASLFEVLHTEGMKLLNRALLLSLLLWCCVAQGTPGLGFDKQALINQAMNWVALEADVNKDQIIIKATDRRLRIPTCPSLFDIAFSVPTSQESIRVECPDTGWSVFIGVKLIKYSKVLTFNRDMLVGDKITLANVQLIEIPDRISGAISNKAAAEGMTLKRDVEAGDLVLQSLVDRTITVFMVNKDILSGEKITIDDVNLVLSSLGRDAHLVHNGTNVFDLVVRGRIQFEHIKRVVLLFARFKTVDGACKNPSRRGLSHSTRPTKQVRLGHLLLFNGLP